MRAFAITVTFHSRQASIIATGFCFMNALLFRRQLKLIWMVVVLVLAVVVVVPVQAARLGFVKNQFYRAAIFQTTSTTRIAVSTNPSASLPDLRVGDHVSIAYDQENGVLVAHHIADNVAPKPLNPNVSTVSHPHHPPTAATFAHIRGIVTAVNVQAGTFTLAYRVR